MKLDAIDRRILSALQRDGRMQNGLAHEVGLSPSPCLRRVRLLEEAGVIEIRGRAESRESRQGADDLHARVAEGAGRGSVNRFAEAVQQMPEVVECHLMAGDCDFPARRRGRHRRLPALPDGNPHAHSGCAEREDRHPDAEGQAHVGAPT